MKEKVYALYQGDKFITVGTVKEIANELGIKEETVRFYSSPAAKRRNTGNGRILVKIEEDE